MFYVRSLLRKNKGGKNYMHQWEFNVGEDQITVESGKLAKQANAAVVVRSGGTVVLVTAVMSDPREGIDFFPLMVNYEEREYAIGKIPGSIMRREGRPRDAATLAARLIDRPLRPLFPDGFRHDVQIVSTVLSVDSDNEPEILAMNGASMALMLSDIPFNGPIGGVRVGLIDGEFIVNPNTEQRERSLINLTVAGTKDAVMMVEAGAKEVSEAMMLDAIMFGHDEIKKIVAEQEKMRADAGKPKIEYEVPQKDEDLDQSIRDKAYDRLYDALRIHEKQERNAAVDAIKDEVIESFKNDFEKEEAEDIDKKLKTVKKMFNELVEEIVRKLILVDKIRPDGRKTDEIRPITCEVGILPRVHGSGVFTRGQTQALTVLTLGAASDEQVLFGLGEEETKRFMHHYNFPPYSVGEVRPLRSPGRREIGHGALGERAIEPVIPTQEEFPYTIRLVSEVLESNGSSSQASICGSILALMDGGVPIKAPVAGIAMGLMGDGKQFVVLSDIQGAEDHYGDMDFKVAGTKEGVTALQMDIKIEGVSREILEIALEQARVGRLFILGEMLKVISESRSELSPYAPSMITMKIDPEKIRYVIGPGGKMIKKIVEETGVKIDIEDDGSVFILSLNQEAGETARDIIHNLTRDVVVGDIYHGKVKKMMNFGAFVEIVPGQEGLCHISKLAQHHVKNVEDIAKVGDDIWVKVVEIDPQGRINLSRKDALKDKGMEDPFAPIEEVKEDKDTENKYLKTNEAHQEVSFCLFKSRDFRHFFYLKLNRGKIEDNCTFARNLLECRYAERVKIVKYDIPFILETPENDDGNFMTNLAKMRELEYFFQKMLFLDGSGNLVFLEDLMCIEVIEKLKIEIEAADGQEVVSKGTVNSETGKIDVIEILARGHSKAAPAIINTLKPATVFIHNHPSGRLIPSDADLRVASMVGNRGAGFLIIDNQVSEGYMVVEPYIPKERERLKTGDILDFFNPNGVLSRGLDNYEYRSQQVDLVKSIAYSFNNRRHLLAEAGTGTGKSMAYLVPAIHWAVKNDEKVVISTNTINLQEQLFYKDIPLLERTLTPLLSREFKSVLVKGRRNYICLRKLNYINQGYEELSDEEKEVMTQINNLVFKENIGSKSEIPFQPPTELWEKISSEAETCLRSKCPHFRGCFLHCARREAAGADLLIVNHHLLFADLAVRKERGDGEVAVLPKYQHLILDEAHNLEPVATEYLGYQLTRSSFLRLLQYIYNTKDPKRQQGLLLGIRGALTKSTLSNDMKYESLRLIDIEIVQAFLKVRDYGHHFFNQIAEFFSKYQKIGERVQNNGENKLRLTKDINEYSEWKDEVCLAAEELMNAINQLSRKMQLLYEEMEHFPDEEVPDYDSLLIELEGRITQLQRVFRTIEFIIGLEDENFVYWIEISYRKNNELYCTLQAAPLEIGGEIKEHVVEALDTVIFTSATLTVHGNFNYLRESLGVGHERVDDMIVGSPFNYEEQAMVAVVKDVSSPNVITYTKEVQDYLLELLEVMKGRTLVLFTSYRMLNSFYQALKTPLAKKGIRIYKQGESSRQKIIQSFKGGERGVIFGTSSFWEGVDIQGDDLSCVVIMKLPFQVPSEPIVEARVEKMEREGKNPFVHFMLPNAVIKFKQGFGRLVRSKEDRGVVVVFDPRIYTKSYGRIFLKSLPQKTGIHINTFDQLIKKVDDFI